MGKDSSFICGRCQRELPDWKEVEDSGLCTACNDSDGRVVWSTDPDEGSVTTTFDSSKPKENLTSNGDENAAGTDGESSDETSAPATSSSSQNNPGVDSHSTSVSESSADTTRTGSHIIDRVWGDSVDTSHIEEASQNVRRSTETEDVKSSDPLDRKIDSWKEQLLDLTRRSNLVDFSPTKTKSLPFHRADPLTISEVLFDREPLYIRRLKDDEEGSLVDVDTLAKDEVASIRDNGETENSLYQIELNQKRYQRERGVDSLFLALGTLRWYDVASSDSELRAPLFLVQVDLNEEPNRNPNRHDYQITSEDAELRVNPALRKMLSAERGIVLPPDTAFNLDDLEACFAYVLTRHLWALL